MESLSGPFHGNQASSATFSKKLSTANSFSAGNGYDDVFTGEPKFRGPTYSSRIEDYNEIFGGSQALRASSVPILDLSAPGEAQVLADVRSSKLDYSNIFGGFREDIAVSFEEMLAKPKGAKNLSDDARTSAKTASPSDRSDHLNRNKEEAFSYEAPNQSIEGMKQFNMSYHKTSQRNNDRTNGTSHVAQLRAVPGLTCFVDENPALQKTKLDNSEPQTKVDANLTKKQTSDALGKFKSQSSGDKFYSNGKPFYPNENNPKRYASKVSSPSTLPANLVSNKSEPKRSMASSFEASKSDASKAGSGDCSPSFSDEEVDVNSAAAASAAALRKALEKAQASIKIAKEFMERKKDGTRRFSKQSSKDGLDVKKRREDKVTVEGNGIREKNSKKICESADVVLQVFAKSEREKARRSGKVAPNNNDSQETSISKEVVGETNGNNLESAEDCQALRRFSEPVNTCEHRTATLACGLADGRNNIMRSVDAHECGKRKIKTAEEILEQLYENGKKVDGVHELAAMEGKLNVVKMTREWEQHVDRLDTAQEVHKDDEDEKAGVDQEDEETEEKQKVSSGQEKCEKKWVESLEPEENEVFVSQDWRENNNDGLDESQECMENEKKHEEVFEKEQNKKSLKDVHKEERENRLKKICEQDEIEKRLQAAREWVDYEEACEVESNQKRENDAHKGEDNEKTLDKIQELDIYDKRQNGTPDGEESEERQEDDSDRKGTEKILMEANEFEEIEGIHRETTGNETTEVNHEAVKQTINLDPVSDACKWDEGESKSESQEAHRHRKNVNGLNIKKNERISDVTQSSCEFKEDEKEFEAVEVVDELGEEEMCKTGGLVGGAVEHIEIQNKVKCATDALLSKDNPANIDLTDMNSGPRQTDQEVSELPSNVGSGIKISVGESGEDEKNSEDKIAFDLEEVKSNSNTAHEKRLWVEMRKKMEASQPCSVFKGEEKTTGIAEVTKKGQITEKNEENLHKTFAIEKKEAKQTAQKEVKAENERLSKNDEANKREREREKDRVAVGRAIREARERAFAEARERAAVERATAEARQRVMVEAREKFVKSSAATKSSAEKASMETKLRAERAAVERATAEARERALEKALSQKTTSGEKGQAERFVVEKFSGVSRDRQSFTSSDKQKLDGTIGESAQRSKARLERHQRTMERAAKALAEKNRRDLLAQKEQAERNRLAETLDAEVKRWSSGKAGNLRALLSTLQYILGRDSGWQPISLTEIITTDAVKKAYRKATLHVHPDKLQQRGASIQQKYICEKVFDLLKAAWNKFNSEER